MMPRGVIEAFFVSHDSDVCEITKENQGAKLVLFCRAGAVKRDQSVLALPRSKSIPAERKVLQQNLNNRRLKVQSLPTCSESRGGRQLLP
jgi:hypothetical protein